MKEISCNECGRTTYAEQAYQGVYTPSGWKVVTRWFKLPLYFCSDGCKRKYESNN